MEENGKLPVERTAPLAQQLILETQNSVTVSVEPTAAVAEENIPSPFQPSKHASLATPAVRGLLKELNANIFDIKGTGKDGRVLKEDVLRLAAQRDQQGKDDTAAAKTWTASSSSSFPATSTAGGRRPITVGDTPQSEAAVPLTPIQTQMFKTMTRSLSIPHFLFADEVNITALSSLRRKLQNPKTQKLTFLPFIIKAVSLALEQYPLLNARIDVAATAPDKEDTKPKIIMRSNHNIGIALDTPQGLIVPNIKNVAACSVADIAAEISRLSALGRIGKLSPADLSGGTFTVSNVGSIGGTYVAPIIVSQELGILGIGRSRTVPVFAADEQNQHQGQVAPAEVVNFSWSADHRVVDGATVARMANMVREYIECPEKMLLYLR
jgi:2-oxoisovalerate dehydrogenase E2 component (dihydrolipoyl transacylase)